MSTAKFDTLSNLAGTQTVPIATVAQGSAKAWVNFNGTGTVAIRASFNVSSITDNGVGDYTVNFTTAMPDANYACLYTNGQPVTTEVRAFATVIGTPTASAVRLQSTADGGGFFDPTYQNVAIFR